MQRRDFLANLPAAGLAAGLSTSLPSSSLFSDVEGNLPEKKDNILEKVKLAMFSMQAMLERGEWQGTI
jgi:hypothetical protein